MTGKANHLPSNRLLIVSALVYVSRLSWGEAFTVAPTSCLLLPHQHQSCSTATCAALPEPHDDFQDKQQQKPTASTTTMIPLSLMETWEDIRMPRRNWLPDDPPRQQEGSSSLGLPRKVFRHNQEWGIHDATTTAVATDDSATMGGATKRTRATKQKSPNKSSPSFSPTSPTTTPVFPCTVHQVAYDAVQAICDKMNHGNFQGRIGVEIDGTQHLQIPVTNLGGSVGVTAGSSASALRRLALVMAQELACSFNDNNTNKKERPVVVYLNTIKQTMLAANDYRHVAEFSEKQFPQNITILTLGDDLPQALHPPPQKGRKKRSDSKKEQDKHFDRGFVVIVQPTDYNDEHQPPGPSIGTVEALQRISLRATQIGLTTILLSPRFLASPHYPTASVMSRQGAAPYGGNEPARQPAPWLMRDFSPPVYSWVGNGVSLSPPPMTTLRHSGDSAPPALRRYTRVALCQPKEEAPWHVFGARQDQSHSSTRVSYDYLASTAPLSGRPTRDVMRHIYEEFHE